ncbi:MAG: GNAT family N-acetyltransferase [Chitinophagaceae bacterium]|nr:GNAT family N-acetyltransferase [Chitinophagaceae bacterium]
MTELTWVLAPFHELTNDQLYALLRLRSEVFVVEQNCVFLDMDNKDQYCYHLLGFGAGELLAYTRLVPVGVAYDDYPSIGRVVSSPQARGMGIGRLLMQQSIEALHQLWGQQPIKIGAQCYLRSFYESLGFVQCGPVYDEDGIDHMPMLLTSEAP